MNLNELLVEMELFKAKGYGNLPITLKDWNEDYAVSISLTEARINIIEDNFFYDDEDLAVPRATTIELG